MKFLIFTFILAICLISLFKVTKYVKNDRLKFFDIIPSTLITGILYAAFVLSYFNSTEEWWLSPYFRLVFIVFILPLLIIIYLSTQNKEKLDKIVRILVLSLVISGIVLILFGGYFFNILKHFHIIETE